MRSITFHPLSPADVPRLTRWLQEEHVRAFWDDGERDETAVYAHYFRPGRDVPGFLFHVDGQPTGFLQVQQVKPGHPFMAWAAPQGDTWGLDLLIGAPEEVGQGLAAQVIGAFVTWWAAQHPGLRRLLIDPDKSHTRAVRAYQKAGFQTCGALADAEGRRLILHFDL
ncbi:hypothetical protein CBQ26_08595 [Deinococcus indicus]|uniref:N-acetyltransferase domain-containing protein n=1 Tax=Deinococcus indicus TaxID=223556 RepID=A0A2D0A7Q0_9DEIO|nr:GNAT family N-acetyltransferase [Deinococcus indicus]OWL96436.1 hypothetical protein CBQ26_08595 [Deinococcus indicus]GHG21287.1 GCN5 family acetyltransferase [Deinococcus indicus]